MKRKLNVRLAILIWFLCAFLSFHSSAQNGNSAKKLPKAVHQQYDSQQHFDTLYKYAKMEFEFKGSNKNDVNKWQQEFRDRLKHSLGIDKIELQLASYTPYTEKQTVEDRGDFILEKWIIWTEPDIPLPVVVLIPKNRAGKLPLVITTHGHGKNADQYDSIYPKIVDKLSPEQTEYSISVQAVKEGNIAIAPTMRAFGSTRTEYDKKNGNSFSCRTQLMNDLLSGRTPIGDRVWDMSKLLDWALNHLPVDETKIAITGNSGGGTVSLFTAACDKRISVAVPSSYFCTFQGSIGTIAHCDCNYIPGILDLGEMSDIAGLIAPRPLCVINGKGDTIFPIEETRKAFAHLKRIYVAAGGPDNVMLYEGNGGHKYYKEGAWPFINKYFKK